MRFEPSGKQIIEYYTVSIILIWILIYMFYRSWLFCLLTSPISILFKRFYIRYLAEKRRDRLLAGFRDFLYSISASISAGYKMPRAVSDAAAELSESFGEESDIAREISFISREYVNDHADIADLLQDLGRRSGLAEIKQFAAAYRICAENGGDIENVCIRNAMMLIDKLEFKSEIRTLIADKKLDVAVLAVMPPAILYFLNISSDDYIEILYSCQSGRIVMSISLALMLAAIAAGIRIVNIKI